jgi:DNA topoisomerase-1
MAKNLVIVESPAKAKTLAKYLGKNFQVKASVGHVVDLPKSKLGVDLERDFEPEYQIIHGKKKIIDDLKKAARDKENIYLAPDPDREGEAIAWHIAEKLGHKQNVYRVLFNEITKKAVLEAIKHPLELNRNRFDAQTARRVLDRLVGYQISPILWKKVRRGLSAGRVQSVAVRLICEREKEIEVFETVEYWTVGAKLEAGQPPVFLANLFRIKGQRLDHKKLRIADEAEAKGLLQGLDQVDWIVSKVEKKERKRHPAPPFITSRLQQEAARKLGFTPKRTMGIAQRLYMGVELGEQGAVGLISYMRTDSVRISNDALDEVRSYIGEKFGKDYLPGKPNFYKSKKSAQDAHEAIRPTSLANSPEKIASFLSREELALYTLIWNRFVACQMTSAVFDQTAVDMEVGDGLVFRATGQVMKFDGFIRVYTEGRDDDAPTTEEDEGEGKTLPELHEGDRLKLHELIPEQHFTQPPPRFTQASLIRALEENGIGRPSTYASIMTTVLGKDYVREDREKRLRPTPLGRLVTDLLVGSFPDILNVEFTAGMEDILDRIEEGNENWVEALKRFYEPFRIDLERADAEMPSVKGEGQKTDKICEKCGAPLVIKWGRQGEFIACSAYPECTFTSNFSINDDGEIQFEEPEKAPDPCPDCGKELIVRYGRFGKFFGCSGYPDCKHIQSVHGAPKDLGLACPDCGKGGIQERRSRRGKVFYGCDKYPECKFATWDPPVIEPCPECGAKYVVEKNTKRRGRFYKCVQEGCEYTEDLEDAVAEVDGS